MIKDRLTPEQWNQFQRVLDNFCADVEWQKKFVENPVSTLKDFPNLTDAYEVFKAVGAIFEMVPSFRIMDSNPYYLEYARREKLCSEYVIALNQQENFKDENFFYWTQIVKQRARFQGWNDKRRENIRYLPVVFESDAAQSCQEIFNVAREELGECVHFGKLYSEIALPVEKSCLAGFLVDVTECDLIFVEPEIDGDKISLTKKEKLKFAGAEDFRRGLKELLERHAKNILPTKSLLTFTPNIKIWRRGDSVYFSGQSVHYAMPADFIFDKCIEQLQERAKTFEDLSLNAGNIPIFVELLREKFQFLYEKGCLTEKKEG